MSNLNHTVGSPANASQAAVGARAPHGGGVALAGSRTEGGAVSAEGAGLVPFKTSPIDTLTSPFQGRNHSKIISFDKCKAAQKRVNRLKSNVWMAGHLHGMPRNGYRPSQAWFVTLTYAKCDGWKANHIAKATDGYRRWCKRRGLECQYLFVAELQARGAVHYHLLVWLPQGVRMPMWDKTTRASKREVKPFWTHGMTNTQPAKAGVGYLMKYLSKLGEFTIFPEGLRLYGMGGLTDEARAIRAWQNLPQWVKNNHGVGEVYRMRNSFITTDGEILPPMYRRSFCPGGVEIFQLREMPEKIYDHGAFCTWPRV